MTDWLVVGAALVITLLLAGLVLGLFLANSD
jgi:hypothetical protein